MVLSKQTTESLRTLLEQHCLHCRHIESERAWFMNIYAALAGGILTYGVNFFNNNQSADNFPLSYVLVLSFLTALTFFGFLLALRWIFAFESHRNRASKIVKLLLPENEIETPSALGMDISQIRLMPRLKNGKKHHRLDTVDKIFSSIFLGTRYLFPLFYFFVLIGVTLFLCFVIPACTWSYKWILFLIPLVALLLGVRWYISLKDAK